MREILIPITFREFDESLDAKIQETWLNRLKDQTYQNFKLIVTNYRETTVRDKLIELSIPHEFIQSQKDCIYSTTEVFSNSFQYVKPKNSIILWITGDHMVDTNFFQVLAENVTEGVGGTSYPHIQHRTYEDYLNGKMFDEYRMKEIKSYKEYDPNIFVNEVIFFDGDVFQDKKILDLYKKYSIEGAVGGICISLMFACWAKKLVNIYHLTKVHKITNTPEAQELSHHSPTWLANDDVVQEYCDEVGISKGLKLGHWYKSRKFALNTMYKTIGNDEEVKDYEKYLRGYFYYPRGEFIVNKLIRLSLNKTKNIFKNR